MLAKFEARAAQKLAAVANAAKFDMLPPLQLSRLNNPETVSAITQHGRSE